MVRSESKEPEPLTRVPLASAPGGPDDEALAALAAQGNVEAFEGLVLRYQDRVFNLLLRMCGTESEAEDLSQETFLKAYRGLGQFRQGSKFYTWLFRIAVNTGFSRGRQVTRRRAREGVSLDAASGAGEDNGGLRETATASAEAAPDRNLERETLRARVREGLEQLDADHRAVILLRDMEGLDYDAVAQALEISRAAVKSRLHRARLELARILKDLKPEGSGGV